MTTHVAPAAATRTDTPAARRPMGSLLAVVSLIAGPALIALALATLTDPWNGNEPDYGTIDTHHGLLLLSFNLAAASFPFLLGSVVALAAAARRSRWLASSGLVCSVFGLMAMFGNSMLSLPLVQMNGIDDRAGLTELATRLDSPPLVALYAFPLYLLGAVLLAAALWRSAALPRWSAICIGIGGLFPLAIAAGVGAIALPIAAVRIAGSVPLVKTLLASRDTTTAAID